MQKPGSWRLILAALALAWAAGPVAAAEVPVAELIKQLPAQDAAAAAEISARLVAAGPAGVKEIAAMLLEPGKGDDAKPRFALHGMAVYVSRPNAEAERKMFVETLAILLGTDIPLAVKGFLIRQLQLSGGKESIDVLAKFLLGDEATCEYATQAMLAIGDPSAADPLRDALAKAQGPNRLTIIQALGMLRDAKSMPALLKAAADDNRDVRLAALAALGNIGDPAVVDTLVKASSPEPLYERARATEALLVLARRLVEADKKADAEKIYRHLLATRTAPEASHDRCAALRGLVAAAGEKATDDLLAATKSEDADVRAVAADLAAAVPGETMTKSLVASLKDAAPAAKVEALAILARRADKAALPAALEALKDADKAVRKAAIKAVAAIARDEAIPTLIGLLAGPERDERQTAADALVLLPGDKATDTLAAALKTAAVEARRELLGVLAARGAKAKLDAIFACTSDENEGVRSAALDAIGVLGDEKALPRVVGLLVAAKGGERGAAERAADAICRRSKARDACADALLAVLPKADVQARCALLRVLGGVGSPKGLDALRSALKDESAEVQEAGVRALARWPSIEVADQLLSLAQTAKDPKHRVLALQGYIRVVGLPSPRSADETLKMYQAALAAAARPEEKKEILGAASELKTPGVLKLVLPCLDDKAIKPEAEAAIVKLSDRLRDLKDAAYRADMRAALAAIAQASESDARRKDAARNMDRWYKDQPKAPK